MQLLSTFQAVPSVFSSELLTQSEFHYVYYNTACISQEEIQLLNGHLKVTHEAVDLFCRYECVDTCYFDFV